MKIEHTAFQVADPVALARWYVEHLGLTVKRSQAESPFGQFLADSGDTVMLEFYNSPKADVPDYRAIDPLVLHIAFWADDVAATAGDTVAMLRDPWGLAIQFVHRGSPMI
jgi:glyoxylase I family protein